MGIMNKLTKDELMHILHQLRERLMKNGNFSYVRVGETSKAMHKLTKGPIENFKNMEWRPDFKKFGNYSFIYDKYTIDIDELFTMSRRETLTINHTPLQHEHFVFRDRLPTVREVMIIPGIFIGSVGPSLVSESRYFIGSLQEVFDKMITANTFKKTILHSIFEYEIEKKENAFVVYLQNTLLFAVTITNSPEPNKREITIEVGDHILLRKYGPLNGTLSKIELDRPMEFYKLNLNLITSALSHRDPDAWKALIDHVDPSYVGFQPAMIQ